MDSFSKNQRFMTPTQVLTPVIQLKKDQINFVDEAADVPVDDSSFIAAADEQGQFPIA